jgi:hypothetical protein
MALQDFEKLSDKGESCSRSKEEEGWKGTLTSRRASQDLFVKSNKS